MENERDAGRAAMPEEPISQEAARAMLAALERVDQHWIEDIPGGPEGPGTLKDGFGTLADSTRSIWRDIRAAIALAERAS